ncbi:MAG: PocR ligand-binding domain-containing protein [Treponema sp.]|jgi:AraC-like DNA-binding protein/ligand-binding sensor protein|nr:PocR ligand-binding domain-containing protein [Treponema sp.]
MNRCRYVDTIDLYRPVEDGTSSNIIKRREIEPLLLKARAMIKSYERAVDCVVSVLDQDGHAAIMSEETDSLCFCSLCRKYSPDRTQVWGNDDYPCIQMHIEGVAEAQRRGGIYIYMCEMGLIYWSSPLYSNGRLAGSLIAGRVLGIKRAEAIKKISAISQGNIPAEEAAEYLADVPERSYEEIKAQASMLCLCAEKISSSKEGIATQESAESGGTELELQRSGSIPDIKKRHSTGPKDHASYSLDKERLLLAALRRGDHETSRKIIKELLNSIVMAYPENFELIQLRAIELMVLLSREATIPDACEADTAFETNNRYFKRIQESRNRKELIENFQVIMDRMAGQIFSFHGIGHASVLRKAGRYIWEHYTRKISLQEIAAVSGLSAPYFSTIFKEEMGENLSSYLNRLRVEKAAVMLVETELSLNQISGACGFEDQSWFSKIFKSYIGISPGKYRQQGGNLMIPLIEEIGTKTVHNG